MVVTFVLGHIVPQLILFFVFEEGLYPGSFPFNKI